VNMGAVIRTRASVAWLLLVALTLSSWVLAAAQGLADEYPVASIAIVLTAVFKIRLVGLYFMELRDAPGALRWAFEGYCLALGILLCVMYLVG
jgi:heme/copper-type cytochrome/quinol oxidase subunit 4